jgi:hypothetical protein
MLLLAEVAAEVAAGGAASKRKRSKGLNIENIYNSNRNLQNIV